MNSYTKFEENWSKNDQDRARKQSADGQTDGQTDELTDGREHGRMDGRTLERNFF